MTSCERITATFSISIIRKIIKIAATRCHIVKLKCTKFYFAWGVAPHPAGELTALPQTHKLDLRGLLLSGGEWTGGEEGRTRERRGRGRKGEGGKGKGEGQRKDRGNEREGRIMGIAHPLFSTKKLH